MRKEEKYSSILAFLFTQLWTIKDNTKLYFTWPKRHFKKQIIQKIGMQVEKQVNKERPIPQSQQPEPLP